LVETQAGFRFSQFPPFSDSWHCSFHFLFIRFVYIFEGQSHLTIWGVTLSLKTFIMTSQGCAIPKCLVTLVTEVCPVAFDILRIIIAVFSLKSIHVYKFTFLAESVR
jgi:hypothetical protein